MNALLEKPALSGEEVARKAMQTPAQKTVDKMQAAMKRLPQVDCPLVHRFTPGLYVREIHVPAGTLVISKIFKAEFPFIISQGKVSIWVEGVGVKKLEAPYFSITKAGMRRIIFHHTDVVLTTLHPTNLTDINQIEDEVIYNPDKDMPVEISAETMKLLKEDV
jgi:hypothetical protein